ncbi:hypothetical protein ACN47E_005500 [Coniothyrium glycines]
MSGSLLHELPDDILISIICHTDIDTLFSLRLSCTNLCNTVDAYITSIAPAVAHNTFPGCGLLLERPKSGYSLRWLRGLIPAQLASIVLDKDKLRRSVYIHSGYPYGVPSESDCEEANRLRERIADGWRVLRSLYLISKRVYVGGKHGSRRPSTLRKVSGGMRSSRIWQVMACPYPGCTEHGVKQLFDGRQKRYTESDHEFRKETSFENIRRKESIILKKRLALIENLPSQDLLNYVFLWRLLLWTFRPYRQPDNTTHLTGDHDMDRPNINWTSIIHDITQGCSWLNWFILSIGPTPFMQQWSLQDDPATYRPSRPTHLRDLIFTAYTSRTPHQIEVEREYVCKLEYLIRRRCLSQDRLQRLDAEIYRGRNIRTISLDCIPWDYDQHPVIARPPRDFPWYAAQQWLWMSGDVYLQIKPGASWAGPGMFRASLVKRRGKTAAGEVDASTEEDADVGCERGPLEHVPYLVYLGDRDAKEMWPGSDGDAAEVAF